MRKFYFLILILVIGLASEAQPQHYNHATTTGGANSFPFALVAATGKKVQWVMLANDFALPSPAPAGQNITSLWFWSNTAGTATYTTLTIRLATVSTSTYIPGTGQWYTGAMTTVRSQNTTITRSVIGEWVQIPLTTPFLYDPTMNLIVEVYHCGFTGTGFTLRQLVLGAAPNIRRQYSDASSLCGVTVLPTGGDYSVAGIGLSLAPSGCTNVTPFGSATINPSGAPVTISTCSYAGEYSTISGAVNGQTLRFTSSVPTDYITIHTGTPSGPVIAFGQTPLVFANTYTGTIYAHWSTNASCGTQSVCRTTTVQCTSCAPCILTCPPNMTVNNAPGQCGANVSFAATASAGCGTITYTPASGSFFPVGTTTVTATAAAGPSCTFTVTVVDNTAPTITCPAPITRNNDAGLCSAVVNYTLPTVSDNCDPPPIQFPASFQAHGGGQVYSLQGNTLPGGLFYTLTNNTASSRTINSFGIRFGDPAFGAVIAPQTLTIWSRPGLLTAANENSTAGWTQQGPQVVNPIPAYFPTGTGPLGICGLNTPVTIAPGASASFFVHGQTACPIFNYNFGFSPPVANGGFTLTGGTVSFDVLGSGNHFNQGTANGIANINVNFAGPIAPVLIAGLASGSVFPVGVTTNTYRATDPAGNSSTCSFNVTVVDAQAPTITCPSSIVRNTDAGVCTASIAVPNPTTGDNCGVTSVSWVMTGATTGSSPLTGINYVGTRTFNLNGTTGQGVSTIVYTVKDAAGNITTCSFTVTVNDLVIPNISAQPATKFVCVGSNGVFSVTATSNGGPLAYQWQTWDGSAWVNIVGATASSYTVPNVSFADNTKSYRVILTGLCSIVTSSAATLYVNPLPTITLITSIPPSLLPGQSMTITATGNPPGGTFEWFKNNVLTGHTGSTWTGLTVDDIGTFKVRYTDPNGCVSTSTDIIVTGQKSGNVWVYPNPNTGNFQVRLFNELDESITIRVFDSKGAKVFEKVEVTGTPYSSISIDLSPLLGSGVYTVDVRGGGGRFVGARRIVVRHP